MSDTIRIPTPEQLRQEIEQKQTELSAMRRLLRASVAADTALKMSEQADTQRHMCSQERGADAR
jgi:hypothetical protein